MDIFGRALLLLLAWLPFLAWPAAAQDGPPPKHRLGAGVGAGRLVQRDDLLSPLRYRGASAAVQLVYGYRGARNDHEVVLTVQRPELASAISDAPDHVQDVFVLRLQGQYARRLTAARPGRPDLWLGGVVDGRFGFTEHVYLDPIEEYAGTFYQAIGLLALVRWPLGPRGVLRLRATAAPAALVSRSPVNTKGQFETRLAAAPDFFRAEAAVAYEHALGRRLALRVDYALLALHLEAPRPLASAHGLATINLLWMF